MLMAQTAGKDAVDLVFLGPQGGPLRHGNFMGQHFRPAVERALPKELHGLRFHDLRHTCASILIAKGAHPLVVSRQLGHSSISITMDR
jgi:integrase